MRKVSKKSSCKSASHQIFKDKAKNRVDDLHGMFADLQYARKESRSSDVAVLEEQVNQMLREWKSELNEPSPASSLLVHERGDTGEVDVLTKGDNNFGDDRPLYAHGQMWLQRNHIMGRAVGLWHPL